MQGWIEYRLGYRLNCGIIIRVRAREAGTFEASSAQQGVAWGAIRTLISLSS